jgi:Zn-finger nucleic acid-binding protein
MRLNCPNSGAGAPDDATSCTYCGSRLATVACPSCLGSMFVGSQFCPHCGAKAAMVEDTSAATLPCPGCNGEMRGALVGTTPMHLCESCGSSWLARDVFESLCADREQQGRVSSTFGAPVAAPKTRSSSGAVRYVSCPACHKILNRVNFGRSSGIVVDVCKPHGIWFERDELRAVLAFVAQGGLQQPLPAANEHISSVPAFDLAAFPIADHQSQITAFLKVLFT